MFKQECTELLILETVEISVHDGTGAAALFREAMLSRAAQAARLYVDGRVALGTPPPPVLSLR